MLCLPSFVTWSNSWVGKFVTWLMNGAIIPKFMIGLEAHSYRIAPSSHLICEEHYCMKQILARSIGFFSVAHSMGYYSKESHLVEVPWKRSHALLQQSRPVGSQMRQNVHVYFHHHDWRLRYKLSWFECYSWRMGDGRKLAQKCLWWRLRPKCRSSASLSPSCALRDI